MTSKSNKKKNNPNFQFIKFWKIRAVLGQPLGRAVPALS